MKFQILKENFSFAVSTAARFASSKAQLPVLGNISLSAKKTKLLILATNLETSIAIFQGAKTEKEGEITIPSRVINELALNLPSGTLDIEVEKELFSISSNSFKSVVSGMNASDFPKVPSSINKNSSRELDKKNFFKAISKVFFAVSTDETRPVLTGVLFLFKKDSLSLIATDGFRLSCKTVNIKISQGENEAPLADVSGVFSARFVGAKSAEAENSSHSSTSLRSRFSAKADKIILPKGILSELPRIFESDSEDDFIYFEFRKDSNQVLFGRDEIILSSRVLEGDFPDFEKIIPKKSLIKVETDKEELLRAVKLASVFARDSANMIRLNFKKDFFEVSAESSLSGSQKTKIDAKLDGEIEKEGFEIAFNFRFLEDFLKVVEGENVEMEFVDSSSPGVFKDPKDPNFLHLIMPVKIQS